MRSGLEPEQPLPEEVPNEAGTGVEDFVGEVVPSRGAAALGEYQGGQTSRADRRPPGELSRATAEIVVEDKAGRRAEVGRGGPDPCAALPEGLFNGGRIREGGTLVVQGCKLCFRSEEEPAQPEGDAGSRPPWAGSRGPRG